MHVSFAHYGTLARALLAFHDDSTPSRRRLRRRQRRDFSTRTGTTRSRRSLGAIHGTDRRTIANATPLHYRHCAGCSSSLLSLSLSFPPPRSLSPTSAHTVLTLLTGRTIAIAQRTPSPRQIGEERPTVGAPLGVLGTAVTAATAMAATISTTTAMTSATAFLLYVTCRDAVTPCRVSHGTNASSTRAARTVARSGRSSVLRDIRPFVTNFPSEMHRVNDRPSPTYRHAQISRHFDFSRWRRAVVGPRDSARRYRPPSWARVF